MEETLVKAYIKKKESFFIIHLESDILTVHLMTRRGIRTIIKKNAQLFLLMNEPLFSMFSFA